MPLPEKAYEYLNYAQAALKPGGGEIHYYDFEHARRFEDPIEMVKTKVSEKLRKLSLDFDVPFQRVVRGIGPNWFQVVLDITIRARN